MLGEIADAGAPATGDARRLERIGWAIGTDAVAALGGVAHTRGRATLGSALHVGGAVARDAVTRFCDVAHAGRRTTLVGALQVVADSARAATNVGRIALPRRVAAGRRCRTERAIDGAAGIGSAGRGPLVAFLTEIEDAVASGRHLRLRAERRGQDERKDEQKRRGESRAPAALRVVAHRLRSQSDLALKLVAVF